MSQADLVTTVEQSVAVDDAEFDTRFDRLVAALERAAAILRQQGEPFWAEWLANARTRIAAYDRYGLNYVLSAYGAMGSLNDLPVFLWADDVGQEFDELRGSIARDARALLRELDRR